MSPEGYGHMIQMMLGLAGGRLITVLEVSTFIIMIIIASTVKLFEKLTLKLILETLKNVLLWVEGINLDGSFYLNVFLRPKLKGWLGKIMPGLHCH